MFCPAEAVEWNVYGERALGPRSSLVGPDGKVRGWGLTMQSWVVVCVIRSKQDGLDGSSWGHRG